MATVFVKGSALLSGINIGPALVAVVTGPEATEDDGLHATSVNRVQLLQ